MKKIFILISALVLPALFSSCKKYLDIVPDNVATIDYAFRLRSTAERFLFTCYSYMPALGDFDGNPANAAGDEYWLPVSTGSNAWQIARGNQNVVNCYMNYWQGSAGGKDLFEGIRQCNIFLDNIGRVPDMQPAEKQRWTAEARFLKAYYHFWLFQMYGPIPLIKANVPVNAGPEQVYPPREPVDSCVNYIVQQLDEAAAQLPEKIENEVSELGRITKAIAVTVKAQVLVTAASPLFNGNADYAGFKGPDGRLLFSAAVSQEKWVRAAAACKDAITLCEAQGYRLYTFNPQFFPYKISDTTRIELSIRNAVCEKWNPEIIWGHTNSMASGIQSRATPRGLDPTKTANGGTAGNIAPTLKIAEMFYSNHGVPITEDKTWDYNGRFKLRTGTRAYRYDIQEGYQTVALHFDREPRFYADLGFDGGIWYGQGLFNDNANLFFVSCKKGQPASAQNQSSYSVTGYWPKKLVNFNNVIGDGNTYTTQNYPWPVIRLANLYLLYAEAENEVNGPGAEVYNYVNLVRARAGIPTVESAWTNYSRNPAKFSNKDGMREIIQRERLIELAFEGQRYWDQRRWKKAVGEMNKPITGWDLAQEDAAAYYREKAIYIQTFIPRDYLWPIPESELLSNKKMNQNPGW